jgi:environmental stress-induced protein Ves
MPVTVVPQADLPISLWPNGAGRKADIVQGDGWLAAFAWLDADAPFSDYSGVDRTITLIDGAGFELRFDTGDILAVAPRQPAAFDGGAPLACHLPHGACRVLNVMTRRDQWRHHVEVGAATDTDADVTILVALDDFARVEVSGTEIELGRWDSCVVYGRQKVDGAGSFVTLRILHR